MKMLKRFPSMAESVNNVDAIEENCQINQTAQSEERRGINKRGFFDSVYDLRKKVTFVKTNVVSH
jgi:hypothetical protein